MDIRSILLVRVSSSVDKDVDHPQFFDPSYPLKYLQAGLQQREDLRVELLDCWVYPMPVSEMAARAERVDPDLVVVSASSFDVNVADEFAHQLKKKEDPPAIIGIGQGFYYDRDEGTFGSNGNGPNGNGSKTLVRGAFDAILLGEPEEEFFRLFDDLRAGNGSENGWRDHFRKSYLDGHRHLVTRPDELPFPNYTPEELEIYRSIFPIRLAKRVRWGYLIALRGCPYACVFCSEVMRVSVGKRLRIRQPSNVVDEMEHLVSQGANILSFQDDSFSANKRFVRELCEELIARKANIPWMARVRVDEVDYELLKRMKSAGAVMLGIGVESGSQRIIEQMKKSYKKVQWADRCRTVFKWTRELGIGTNAYYIIGAPSETREEIEQTIQLALELNADSIQVHFYTPYPGSESWEEYANRLGEHNPTEMFHYAKPVVTLAEVSVEELLELRSQFYKRYIHRPSFAIRHMWHHAGFYMKNPDILKTLLGIRKVF